MMRTLRIRWAAWGIGLVLVAQVAGCRSLEVDNPPLDQADWPTEGDGTARAYYTADRLVPPLETAWTYDARAGFGLASPLVWGRTVIVANRKGEVHLIDSRTGKRQGVKDFADTFEGSPLVHGETLFLPSGWGNDALVAYDLSRGKERWSLKGAPVDAGLLLTGETLLAADRNGTVRAIDPATGAVRWERPIGDAQVGVRAAPVQLTPETVLIATDRADLVAVETRHGAVRWSTQAPGPVYRTPAVGEGLVYVPTTRGRLVAYAARTGREVWRYVLPDTTVRFTSPAVSADALVVGTSDGRLHRLDPRTGEARWTIEVGEALVAPPLITRDVVYVGGMDRRLAAIEAATGAVLWSQELKGRIKTPMAFREGALVVLTEPRTVYLFRAEEEAYAAGE